MQDLNRLTNTSDEEFNASRGTYARDRSQLNLSDTTARAWADFHVQLQRAGSEIENVFIKGLTPLIPSFAKLSESVSKALAGFLSNPKLGQWIESFGSAIEKTATYLGSDEFAKSVNKFVDGVSVLGEKIYWLMSKLGWVKGDATAAKSSPPPMPTATSTTAEKSAWQAWKDANAWGAFKNMIGIGDGTTPTPAFNNQAAGDKASVYGLFSQLENQRNLPPGLLRAIYKQESNEGKNVLGPMTKYGQAKGPFQFIPSTAKEYGLDDPMNTEQSADAASKKFRNLLKYYKGDVSKAIAAYNTGEGNLDAAIRKGAGVSGPMPWLDYTSKETQGYVTGVNRNMNAQQPSAQQSMNVNINNNTGGSAVVTTNQLAH